MNKLPIALIISMIFIGALFCVEANARTKEEVREEIKYWQKVTGNEYVMMTGNKKTQDKLKALKSFRRFLQGHREPGLQFYSTKYKNRYYIYYSETGKFYTAEAKNSVKKKFIKWYKKKHGGTAGIKEEWRKFLKGRERIKQIAKYHESDLRKAEPEKYKFCQDDFNKERDWFFKEWDKKRITGAAPTAVVGQLYPSYGCVETEKKGYLKALRGVAKEFMNCARGNVDKKVCWKNLKTNAKNVSRNYGAKWIQ